MNDKELIDHALGHERAYWRRMLSEHGIDESRLPDLEQVVAHLTLIGGTRTAKESREVIERTPRLRGAPLELVEASFGLLRRMYPNNGGISGLLPDLLGERLVALALDQDDGLLDVCLDAQASSQTARRSLTLLARLAQRFPEEGRWLAEALRRYLPARRREARLVATEAGGPMPAILMEVLTRSLKERSRADFRMVLDELWQNVPRDSLYLQDFAIGVAEQSVVIVEAKSSGGYKREMQRFTGHSTLGDLLSKYGRLSESAEHYRLAYTKAQTLAKGKTPAGLKRLARAGGKLASALSKLGRFEEALERAEQAEGLLRELAGRQPDAYYADWANSLSNLANRLSDLGRFEQALERGEQAQELHRELAGRQPDAYRPDWAMSLMNLASHLGELGRFEQALERAEQAQELYRELAGRQPDAYSEKWAKSLSNLASHLRDLGRFEEALERADQAEGLLRELAGRQPDAYRADWAHSLGVLAEMLALNNRTGASLEPGRRSVEIFADLYALWPSSYRDRLGMSRRLFADALLGNGKNDEALLEARLAYDLLCRNVVERCGSDVQFFERAALTLARCEEATGGDVADVLLKASDEIAPWLHGRERILREPVREMIAMLQRLAPDRLDDIPPSMRHWAEDTDLDS